MNDIREICTLSDDELEARRRELQRELVPHIRERRALADGVALAFDATPERRRALEEFVAFERGCCAALRFGLREEAGTLRLEIGGLDPGADDFLAAAPVETPPAAGASGALRALRAGGLGALGAFVLFCGLPLAAVAVVGAELAGPLGVLDHPLALGLGTLLFAAGLWRWERRRAGARRAGSGCGC